MDDERSFDLKKILIAIIVIVAIIIAVIVIINLVKNKQSKNMPVNTPTSLTDDNEKYQSVINDIERGANTFVLANNDVLIFKKADNTSEYSCVMVGTLIDDSYLSRNILDKNVSSKRVVLEDDYVYVLRNTTDKEISKILYIQDLKSDYQKKCADFPLPATGKEIEFEFSPSLDVWSKEKEATITYQSNNYKYYYKLDKKGECLSGCNTDDYIKKIKLTEAGTLDASIKDLADNLIYSNKIEVLRIDDVGPTIKFASSDKLEYTGDFSVELIVTDTGSGVNHASFTKDDLEVYIGGNTITNYSLKYKDNDVYTLKISPDGKMGKLKLKIKKDGVLDNVVDKNKNGNLEIVLTPDITVKAVAEKPNEPSKINEPAKNYIIYQDTNYDYNKAKFSDTLVKAASMAQDGNIIVLNVDNFTDTGFTNNKNIIINTNGKKLSLISPIINNGELLIQGNTTGILESSKNWQAKDKDWLIENYGTLITNYINIENASKITWAIANMNEFICQDSTKINSVVSSVAAVKGRVSIGTGCAIISGQDGIQITSLNTNGEANLSYVVLSGGEISSKDVGVRIASPGGNFIMNSGTIGANYGVVAYNGMTQLFGGSIYGTSVGAYITNGTVMLGKNDGKIEEQIVHVGSINNYAIGVFEGGSGHFEWYDGTIWANMKTAYYGNPIVNGKINKRRVSLADIPYSYQNYLSYQ